MSINNNCEGTEPHLSIFLLFGSLLVGALIRHLFKNSKIPYTVWLLMYGMIIGGLSSLYGHRLGFFHDAVNTISNIEPHLLLYLFLPPLIFESAYSIDYHTFKKTFIQSFILSVPGVLISTVLTAVGTKFLIYSSWSWNEALLLGAILSATDPVAVVALVKSMRGCKVLAALIESESLVNDGTAVVTFLTIYQSIHEKTDANISEFIIDFTYKAVGGVLFGILCGVIILKWMSTVFNDAAIEITITLASAYLVFFIAENNLFISGVLTVLAFGLCFSKNGITTISPEIHHFLHEFWHMLEYLANTLIFVITGLIIVTKSSYPKVEDGVHVILLYLVVTFARIFIIVLCYPLFSRMKDPFTWKEAIIVVWGGLRGAVGLSLALVVHLEVNISFQVREQILFLVAGIVITTLIINGTSMRYIVESLGFSKETQVKKNMRMKAWLKLRDEFECDISELKTSPFYSNADWNLVKQYAGVETVLNHDKKRNLNQIQPHENRHGNEQDLWNEIRNRVLMLLRRCFLEQYEMGMIEDKALSYLMFATTVALDSTSESVLEWEAFKKYTVLDQHQWLLYIPILRRLFMSTLYNRLAFGIDIANGFRYAHETVLKLLNESHLAYEVRIIQKMQTIMRTEMQYAQQTLYDMYNIFPEIYISISTRHSTRILLHNQRDDIYRLERKGLIDGAEAAEWASQVEVQMKKVYFMPTLLHLPSKDEILREIPWIKSLKPTAFACLSYHAEPTLFSKGQYLVEQGDIGRHVYILSRGMVSVILQTVGQTIRISDIGVGVTIGEMSLLQDTRRICSVQAQSTALAFKISFLDMKKIMALDVQLIEDLWIHAAHHLAENKLCTVPEYADMAKTKKKLKRYIKQWEIRKIGPMMTPDANQPHIKGEIFSLKRSIILVHGRGVLIDSGAQISLKPFEVYDISKKIDPTTSWINSTLEKIIPKRVRGHIEDKVFEVMKRFTLGHIDSKQPRKTNTDPCQYYTEAPLMELFLYENSRIMLAPHDENASVMIQETPIDNDRLKLLQGIQWIKRSGEDVSRYFLKVAEDRVYHAGHSFILNRTVADSFYIIVSGTVIISAEIDGRQVIVDTIGTGFSIGELGYLTGEIRNATVTAKTQIVVMYITYDYLERAVKKYPQIKDSLWHDSSIKICRGVLNSAKKFKHLTEETIKAWIDTWEIFIPSNQTQGEHSHYLPPLFIMVYGDASLTRKGGAVERLFAPMLVTAPNFEPQTSRIEFSFNTRLMIPTVESTQILQTSIKAQELKEQQLIETEEPKHGKLGINESFRSFKNITKFIWDKLRFR